MKRIIFILSVFISLSFSNSFNPSIALEDYYKVDSTFSGNTTEDGSFHLIIAKNKEKKQFEIIPFNFKNGTLTRLNPIVYSKLPGVLSFHNSKDKLTLITSVDIDKNKLIYVADIDLITGKVKKSNPIPRKDFTAVLREKEKSILVFNNKKEIKTIVVNDSKSYTEKGLTVNEKNKKLFKELSTSLEAVNTIDYVANGSIKNNKIYYDKGEVCFTIDYLDRLQTKVIRLNTLEQSDSLIIKKNFYQAKSNDKANKMTSYLANGKLYQVATSKENLMLTMHDQDTELSKSVVVDQNMISKKGEDFEDLPAFLKEASKTKNQPTVTINKTNSNAVVARFDFVNKNVYSYRYDWWWHHQWFMNQQMIWQHHQDVMNSIPRFTPSPDIYEELNLVYSSKKAEKMHFEVSITPDFEISNKPLETTHKDIDKKYYIDLASEKKGFENTSTVFVKDTFRFFAFNKNSKEFTVFEKAIND